MLSALYAIALPSVRLSVHPSNGWITWLKITERIQFRLCVLVYRCLHGSAPQYIAETLHLTSDTDTVVVYDLALRRLCSCRRLDDPVSAIGHFQRSQRDHGTLSRPPCEQFHLT